jgi:AcrR family transcriptional regulator
VYDVYKKVIVKDGDTGTGEAAVTGQGATRVRGTYRHGDLRQALLLAGMTMAREGGPDAVVLREATRQAGVSPNAAYRHFADRQALLLAVSAAAQSLAADSMSGAVAGRVLTGDAASDARSHLRSVGTGYLLFAREEPGLFRVAFSVPDDLGRSGDPTNAGSTGLTPFQILGAALDDLEAAGLLPAERRPNAELLAWSAVHGLGMLAIDGPLRGLGDVVLDAITMRLLDMVDRGI